MKKHIALILLAAFTAATLFTACEKDFDSINKDPNGITDVPAGYLLPGAVMSLANAGNSFMESFAYASDWVQHVSCGFWTDPGRYNFEKSRSFIWDNLYIGPLNDLKVMNRKAVEESNPSLEGVSLVLFSFGFSMLADCFGPIPYSQALSAELGANKPVYDSQEKVYLALLDTLKKANQLLDGAARIDIQQGYDVLYNGDARRWQKFCNALRLRLMIRISGKIDMSPSIKELIENTNAPLPEGNEDDALFSYSAASTRTWHPLYDVLSSEASDGGWRISKTLADHLIASADPRLGIYAQRTETGEYAGLPNGVGSGSGQIDDYSRINYRWGQKDRKGILMSFAEVRFLMAEAAARNLVSGDARIWYEEAVQASFTELGLSAGEFSAFISSPQGRYTNLERIGVQKWVSLFGRGLEAWTEYRRTGVPALQPAAYGLVDQVPSRFLYPLSEEQTNRDNLTQASGWLSKGDQLTSVLWWMNR